LLALSQPALAAPPFTAPGLIEPLTLGEVVGDGATPVQLWTIALDVNGAPIEGLVLVPKSKTALATGWTGVGGGLYRLEVIPPSVEAPYAVDLSLSGKTAAKEPVKLAQTIAVRPPLSTRLTSSANPPELVLGDGDTSAISFTLEGGEAQPLAGADLLVEASVGTIENLTAMGGGKFTARYVPPKSDVPQLALIVASDRRDPERVYTTVTVELSARREQTVKAAAKSTVLLEVGGKQFGPVTASSSGSAKVPITLGPGDTTATLTQVVDGRSEAGPYDLALPETPRLALFPLPAGLPGDAAVALPVRVTVRTPTGAPDTAASPAFTTTAGTFGPVRHEGDGVYAAELQAPSTPVDVVATIEVSLGDKQKDSASLRIVGGRPTGVTLTATPARLPAGATTVSVNVFVTGAGGVGLPGRTLHTMPTGAKVTAVKDLGSGNYRVDLTPSGAGPIDLEVTASTPATGNPLRRLLVVPYADSVPNDGISSNLINVLALDRYGYPVAGVPVGLAVTRGGGSLPASTTTGPDGLSSVYYTAARTADLVRVIGTSGDSLAGCSFLQVPAGVSAPDIPPAGTAADVAVALAWQSVSARVRIERE
jgi:hypothetical protein